MLGHVQRQRDVILADAQRPGDGDFVPQSGHRPRRQQRLRHVPVRRHAHLARAIIQPEGQVRTLRVVAQATHNVPLYLYVGHIHRAQCFGSRDGGHVSVTRHPPEAEQAHGRQQDRRELDHTHGNTPLEVCAAVRAHLVGADEASAAWAVRVGCGRGCGWWFFRHSQSR